MPIITEGASADVVLSGNSTLTIQNPSGFATVEFPIGTVVWKGGQANKQLDLNNGTARITANTGLVTYYATGDNLIQDLQGSVDVNGTPTLITTNSAGQTVATVVGAQGVVAKLTAGTAAEIQAANSAALTQAFTDAAAGTMVVAVPAGDYYFNTSVDVSVGRAMQYASAGSAVLVPPSLVGNGRGRTNLHFTGSGNAFRYWAPRPTYPQMFSVRIAGLSLYGPGDLTNTASCGFQFGGVDASASNVMSEGELYDVLVSGFYAGTRHDDCTKWSFPRCYFENCVVGNELAYNCDLFNFQDCSWGDQGLPVSVSCATNSDTSITGINATTWARIPIGAYVIGASIPADTKVSAKPTSGTITIGNAATATNASDSIDIALMTAVFLTGTAAEQAASIGPVAWTPAFNTNRGNQNAIRITGSWFMRVKEAIYSPSASAREIVMDGNYSERGYQLARLGNSTSSTIPGQFRLTGHHFSQPQSMRYGAVIQTLGGAGNNPDVVISGCKTDATGNANLPKVPWLSLPSSYSQGRLRWDSNVLPVDTSVVTSGPLSMSGLYANSVQNNDVIRIGTGESGGYFAAITLPGALSWDAWGIDGLTVTLTGAATINNPGSVNAAVGKVLTFVLIQDATGGRSVTFGTKFLSAAGTAIGTTAAGTPAKRASISFKFDGVNYRAMDSVVWA